MVFLLFSMHEDSYIYKHMTSLRCYKAETNRRIYTCMNMASASTQPLIIGAKPPEIVRRSAAFHPNVWGDYFLKLSQNEKKLESMRERANVLKEEALKKLSTMEGEEKLELVDTLYHLGVSYNFDNQIEEALQKMYKTYDLDAREDNLYTLALRFRLLRQNGWNASSGVFNKFKETNGSFKESVASDVVGMLSLYEASYVGTKEDKIVDEAIAFTTEHLRAALPNMEDPLLAERVAHSLELPLHKRMYRVEARDFISLYGRMDGHDKVLLEYAKLDYNILQALHQSEIRELTKWWKNEGLVDKMKFARDRVTECYLWSLGAYFEPQYSRPRMLAAKMMNIASVIDDLHDLHGTEDELQLFSHAVHRWDIKEIESLPEYIKPLYKTMINCLKDFEDEQAQEGNLYRASYLKQAVKDICREHFVDAKWYFTANIPQLNEYLRCAETTCAYPLLVTSLFAGAGEYSTKKATEWIISYPKYMEDTCRICRIYDDIKGYKFEQERGNIASVVVCYMKEHKCTEEEALEKLVEDIRVTWKDINKACMRPTPIPMAEMKAIRNLSCVMEVLYQYGDGYVFPQGKTKECITALLKDPIPV